ncbi:hypothetical protein JO972_16675 [Verrucomicrobiaceae bacterium 5K15]|uniref:Uncharacterized protein n=1 Tax=Oceaniferula flava TaxID=2800421 RepID=A0AAE2VE12_9BACT|nr:hypothetical protein [Oceaniferula flavus]MBK1856601.1 hypothetical protein [Oceaniferula flavus]MBM1137909.1 hypothetical protein [Oceaniferula flavus]
MKIKDIIRLRRLQRKKDKTNKLFMSLLSKAKTGDERHELGQEGSNEESIIQFEIDDLITTSLTSEAERLFIPVTPKSDYHLGTKFWKGSTLSEDILHLSQEAICELRETIRQERKKQREVWMTILDMFSKAFVILTGLTGALIGLFSVIAK